MRFAQLAVRLRAACPVETFRGECQGRDLRQSGSAVAVLRELPWQRFHLRAPAARRLYAASAVYIALGVIIMALGLCGVARGDSDVSPSSDQRELGNGQLPVKPPYEGTWTLAAGHRWVSDGPHHRQRMMCLELDTQTTASTFGLLPTSNTTTGVSCLAPARRAAHRLAGSEQHDCSAGFGAVVGIVTNDVAAVRVELSDGSVADATRYPAPKQLSFRGAFFAALWQGPAGSQSIRGYDRHGHTRAVLSPHSPNC
jgi:hypothetical protein